MQWPSAFCLPRWQCWMLALFGSRLQITQLGWRDLDPNLIISLDIATLSLYTTWFSLNLLQWRLYWAITLSRRLWVSRESSSHSHLSCGLLENESKFARFDRVTSKSSSGGGNGVDSLTNAMLAKFHRSMQLIKKTTLGATYFAFPFIISRTWAITGGLFPLPPLSSCSTVSLGIAWMSVSLAVSVIL